MSERRRQATMINVSEQINAVQRVVGSRVLDAGEARVATISQTYDATIEDVWDACTNPERIPRWFLPVSGELRVGGHYQFRATRAAPSSTARRPPASAPPGSSAGTSAGSRCGSPPHRTGGTLFTLEHTASVDDEKWAEYGPGAIGVGWDGMVLGLALHLASGESNDPGRDHGVDDVGRGPRVHDARAACAGRTPASRPAPTRRWPRPPPSARRPPTRRFRRS